MLPEYKAKEQLCEAARHLAARGFLDKQGCLALRSGNAFWMTPLDLHPALLSAEKLLRVDGRGLVYGRGAWDEGLLGRCREAFAEYAEAQAVFLLRGGRVIAAESLSEALWEAEQGKAALLARVVERVAARYMEESGESECR